MTDEAHEHPGLPVPGYKPQPQENIDLVAEGKLIEEIALRFLDQLEALVPTGHVDARMVALARTHIQTGWMWAARSVFQPTRIAEISEHNFDHLLRK